MASLKEVKGRIASIQGTLKITSAMKMVSSSKLHRAQSGLERLSPYRTQLDLMLRRLLASGVETASPYVGERPVQRIALVVCASNSSLCGGYNSNIIRHVTTLLGEYEAQYGKEQIDIYPVGKKVHEAVSKAGFKVMGDYQHLSGRPTYEEASALAGQLMGAYEKGEIDRVELLYNHFKSIASQELTHQTFLPFALSVAAEAEAGDYLIEPTAPELLDRLIPQTLRLNLFEVLSDAATSEHAARMLAMQVATDNGNELIQELTMTYNKTRQQAITNELLDIASGSSR